MTIAEFITGHEGVISWMYLDTGAPPNVTIGVGHVVRSAEEAAALAWLSGDANTARSEWSAVCAAAPSMKASAYQTVTTCRLDPAAAAGMLDADIASMLPDIERYFPAFASYPPSVQIAIQDMAFNLGPHFPPKWPQFTAAVQAQNWSAAALQCHRQGVSPQRNADTAALFQQAAGTSA